MRSSSGFHNDWAYGPDPDSTMLHTHLHHAQKADRRKTGRGKDRDAFSGTIKLRRAMALSAPVINTDVVDLLGGSVSSFVNCFS